LLIGRSVVGARLESGALALRALTGGLGIQVEVVAILLRPPRKAVDAVEAEDVIDAEEVEELAHAAHPAAPPAEIIGAHGVPVIQGDAPVLPPLLDEGVVLEDAVRRGASRPAGAEKVRLRPDVGAVI